MPAGAPIAVSLSSEAFPASVREVIRLLQEAGHAAYAVGGCVRDLLRGRTPKDFDVATAALPGQVQSLFKKVIPTGIEHGTVTVMSRGEPIEVTTFRTEGEYRDGRRPSSVAFIEDVTGDLSRRDFTINAMAFDPTRNLLVDPFGGRADLAAGVVRCVGEPAARFGEDGLRALRAVRFAAVLDFQLDPATEAAIPATLPVFAKLSIERVRDELLKLLVCPRAGFGLELLERTGLLPTCLPEAAAELSARKRWVDRVPASLETRLGALLHGVATAEAVLLRLKLPNKVATTSAGYVRHALEETAQGWSDPEVRRWMARAGAAAVEPILAIAEARDVPGWGEFAPRFRALLAAKPPLEQKELALRGDEVMAALGVGPSPAVGEARRFLMEAVLDRPEDNTPERLRALLAAFRPRP